MPVDPAFARLGRFFKGNLHTHSTASDAAHPPETVARLYRDAGYDFLAITDHFLAKFDFPIVDTTPFRTNSFTTLLGAEVHAPALASGEAWHILAVGLPADFAPTRPDETGPELAARCVAAGAFVALAHPEWYGLTLADAATIPDAHAVEIYNHTSEVRTGRGGGAALIDQMLASGRRPLIIATDDAHFRADDAFGGFVMVKAEANEPEALLEALKAGAFYASQGPLIHDVVFDGTTVRVTCSPAKAVLALGLAPAATQVFGEDLTDATLDLSGAVARGGVVRLVVVGADGRRAWTNPIALD
jgi:hypothetical protein